MSIDTHAHLDQEEFDADRAAVIARAQAAGVSSIVSVGVGAASSRQTVALAAAHENVFAAVGIHPNYSHEAAPGDWDEIVRLSGEQKVVALGETGLDRYRDYAPFELQQEYFNRHLELSQKTGLPFIVHARESLPEIMSMLSAAARRGPLRGVMHSYTGDLETARACIDLGLFISFAGMLTFKKSQPLRDVAAALPADRILVETDSPYLAPEPFRGKRNEPSNVVHTVRRLAEARKMSFEQVADQTAANARQLFRLVT